MKQQRNIYSFKGAIEAGLNPKEYKYGKDVVPIGTFEAVLDFKIWAYGDMPAVTCYFTMAGGEKVRVNVFRNKEEEYIPGQGSVNLRYCPIETKYKVSVELTSRKSIKVISIEPLIV